VDRRNEEDIDGAERAVQSKGDSRPLNEAMSECAVRRGQIQMERARTAAKGLPVECPTHCVGNCFNEGAPIGHGNRLAKHVKTVASTDDVAAREPQAATSPANRIAKAKLSLGALRAAALGPGASRSGKSESWIGLSWWETKNLVVSGG
jgi:hypothetical protein